jgi:adenylate cyclase
MGWFSDWCQPAMGLTCELPDGSSPPPAESYFEKFALPTPPGSTLDLHRQPLLAATQMVSSTKLFGYELKHAGYFNAIQDRDGTIRRTNLVLSNNNKLYPSLALGVAEVVLGERAVPEFAPTGALKALTFPTHHHRVPVSPAGFMEINFHGGQNSFTYLEAGNLFSESPVTFAAIHRTIAEVPLTEVLKDAIVLIGVSAIAVSDLRNFPFEANMPGVEGHANIIENILSGTALRDTSAHGGFWVLLLLMTGGMILFTLAIHHKLHPLFCLQKRICDQLFHFWMQCHDRHFACLS